MHDAKYAQRHDEAKQDGCVYGVFEHVSLEAPIHPHLCARALRIFVCSWHRCASSGSSYQKLAVSTELWFYGGLLTQFL
eukprot:1156461-Pelagomonas_calceolata.AAC.2